MRANSVASSQLVPNHVEWKRLCRPQGIKCRMLIISSISESHKNAQQGESGPMCMHVPSYVLSSFVVSIPWFIISIIMIKVTKVF